MYIGSTGSNTNPIENVSSVVNNTTNPLIISQPKIRTGKKHIPHPATTITNTNTHTDITLKSYANLRKQEKLVPGTKTVRVDNNVRRNNNDSLRLNKNDNDSRYDVDVEYGSDAVRIIRQRTKLNLYTGTSKFFIEFIVMFYVMMDTVLLVHGCILLYLNSSKLVSLGAQMHSFFLDSSKLLYSQQIILFM